MPIILAVGLIVGEDLPGRRSLRYQPRARRCGRAGDHVEWIGQDLGRCAEQTRQDRIDGAADERCGRANRWRGEQRRDFRTPRIGRERADDVGPIAIADNDAGQNLQFDWLPLACDNMLPRSLEGAPVDEPSVRLQRSVPPQTAGSYP